jgi:hypothetical protein
MLAFVQDLLSVLHAGQSEEFIPPGPPELPTNSARRQAAILMEYRSSEGEWK